MIFNISFNLFGMEFALKVTTLKTRIIKKTIENL